MLTCEALQNGAGGCQRYLQAGPQQNLPQTRPLGYQEEERRQIPSAREEGQDRVSSKEGAQPPWNARQSVLMPLCEAVGYTDQYYKCSWEGTTLGVRPLGKNWSFHAPVVAAVIALHLAAFGRFGCGIEWRAMGSRSYDLLHPCYSDRSVPIVQVLCFMEV